MDEYLLIVAGDQRDLSDYLTQRFSGIERVRVFLDRRRGERRQRLENHEPQRRQADRRRRPSYPRSDWFVIVPRQAG